MIDNSKRTGRAIKAHEETNQESLIYVQESVPGTSRTCRHSPLMSAVGGKPDNTMLNASFSHFGPIGDTRRSSFDHFGASEQHWRNFEADRRAAQVQ
jgi:hypothetical protein